MFLDRIIAGKLGEVEQRQEVTPLSELEASVREKPLPMDFGASLSGAGIRLIAEVKRASPSRGLLCPDLNPAMLAAAYAECGAAAVSVLTESRHFKGSPEDLEIVRQTLPDVPLLRKDFILKPYQVFESRAWGADALLLIAAILENNELKELLSLSHDLGMQCLVEVHSEAELDRTLSCAARIIGINNRNLDTLSVDMDVTRRLCPLIPSGRITISESGIRERSDIQKLKDWGIDAVLIGEAFITATSISAKIKELFDQGQDLRHYRCLTRQGSYGGRG